MTNKHAVIAAVAMVAVAVIGGAVFAVSQGAFEAVPGEVVAQYFYGGQDEITAVAGVQRARGPRDPRLPP